MLTWNGQDHNNCKKTDMKITKEALRKIEEIAHDKNVETGGILGAESDDTVSCVFADLPDSTAGCRFDYFPNTVFLNKQIEAWSENNIEFVGMFHTHFSGSKNLSAADSKYIEAIMNESRGITEYLYFPVFTLPDNELTVYKACFDGKKTVIAKDILYVI